MSGDTEPVITDPVITELQAEISEWVDRELKKFRSPLVRDRKLVRDALHGFFLLEPYEIEIIDSPLMQRLRYIHQTAFAYLVYPGMNHTRFEHSLGVAQIATQMLSALESNAEIKSPPRIIRQVRLAAILHDISHTFLSHIGESILSNRYHQLFKDIKSATYDGKRRFFRQASDGEIMAFLMITSNPFVEFLDDVCSRYTVTKDDPYNAKEVAQLIIGQTENTKDEYLAEIINGPLDADKLDYLLRDCYFSGIRYEVDVPRIVNTLGIIQRVVGNDTHYHLTVKGAALPHLEQILIAKVMMHTSIYHHHKIRALECLVKGLFEIIDNNSEGITNPIFRLERITDFFNVSEFDFLSSGRDEPLLAPLIDMIIYRNLPKRSLVLCKPSVYDWPDTLASLSSNIPNEEVLRKYRQQIFDDLDATYKESNVELLWIDNPQGPRIQEEALHCYVDLGAGEPETLASLFPSDDWLRSYVTNKLRAHVFYTGSEEARKQVAIVSERFFKEEFNITIKPQAYTLAHLSI